MYKKTIKAILTSAGSQVAPSLINMLKENNTHNVIVIGVDAGIKDQLIGRHFCDHFYTVPYAYEKGYISSILDISKKEKISIIFPGSDEEALILSRNKNKLFSVNTKVACSDASSIKMSMDKLKLMALLRENGIRIGEFYELNKLSDIKKHIFKLGYPSRDVVIKPRVARGSRGFRIITSNLNLYEKLYYNKFYFVSLKEVHEAFRKHSIKLKDFFVMEYLPGHSYSVDILMEHSKPVICVCRRKIFPINSPTQIADIVYKRDIIQYARDVASLLGFDYFVQVEVGRNKHGKPCLIEINPRIDATLPIVEGLKINYFEYMIYYALNGTFPKQDFKFRKRTLRFYRYWQHIFRKI